MMMPQHKEVLEYVIPARVFLEVMKRHVESKHGKDDAYVKEAIEDARRFIAYELMRIVLPSQRNMIRKRMDQLGAYIYDYMFRNRFIMEKCLICMVYWCYWVYEGAGVDFEKTKDEFLKDVYLSRKNIEEKIDENNKERFDDEYVKVYNSAMKNLPKMHSILTDKNYYDWLKIGRSELNEI